MKEDVTTKTEDLPEGECRGDLIYREGDWLFNPFMDRSAEAHKASEEVTNETGA